MSWRDRQRRLRITLAVVYGTAAVVTYGHAATASALSIEEARRQCLAGRTVVCVDNAGAAAVGGLIGAIFWPLYWSWELQS